MVKSKTENKKPAKATSPYAKPSKEPSTPSTQGTNMSTEDLDANISEVGQKLGVSRKLYDEADDMSVDDVKIPRKVNAKKLTKVCYTPPKKIIGKCFIVLFGEERFFLLVNPSHLLLLPS
jgi:hypothetical protein